MNFDLRSEIYHTYAVWYRHAKRYFGSWLVNCVPPICEPVVYLFAFGIGMGPLVGEVEYLGKRFDYFEFIAPGMIATGVLFQAFFEGALGTFVRIRYQYTWQAILTTPIRFRQIFLGELLWAVSRGMLAGVLTALAAYAFGVLSVATLVHSLPFIVLGAFVFASLGMCAAGIVTSIDQLNIPIFLLVVPMFAFCGTYFPRAVLPELLQSIAAFLPLSALVDLMRAPLALESSKLALSMLLLTWALAFSTIAYRRIAAKLFQ